MTAPRFIEVALPLPLFQTFTYSVGDGPLPPAGSRVLVPVRNKRAIGISLGETDGAGIARPRAIIGAPDAEPVLSEAMMSLCRWMAEYYVVPLGIVMRSVLPVLLTGEREPTPSAKTLRVAAIVRELPSLQERDAMFKRAPRQRALYEVLEQMGGRGEVPHLTTQLGFGSDLVRALEARGLIAIETSVVARDPFSQRARIAATPHEPSAAQRDAIEQLKAAQGGDVFLLHGVTGSGKTLVYIELLREIVMSRGQSAIVLVPEIALTPQTVDRFRAVFGDEVAVLHSALSDGERYDAYLALRRGEKRIAVGARSAIFAPLANLGAIIVDEEHEGSYKNGETPRYHAREVAMVRARAEGAVVVLGSATPSLESWENAAQGKYTLLSLPERVGAAKLPTVEVVDLRHSQRLTNGKPVDPARVPFNYVFSEPLEAALGERLQKGEQSILLLNRRGYASVPAVRCVRNGAELSELQHHAHVSPQSRAADLPLLSARGAAGGELPKVRRRDGAAARARYAAGGAADRGAISVCAHRANGCGHDERKVGARRDPRSRGARRGRDSARHADDREGARLSERDAGGRDRCGRRDQSAGLSRLGAELSATEPGGGARGARAEGRRGDHPDARADAPRGAVRGDARLSRVRAAGVAGEEGSAVSAGDPAGERDPERAQ